jgi:large subunit ribosomal protein L21
MFSRCEFWSYSIKYSYLLPPVQATCFAGFRRLHTAAAVTPSSTTDALNFIRSQPSQYIVATFAGRKYLLAPRDVLTVPRLKDVKVGDVLQLDEIHELGSREFTLRGNPTIPVSRVKVEATVVEHTKGKMEFIFKKKRRKGYQKTKRHKQTYTRLRVGSIEIPTEIQQS